jgi:uncharacterized protein involved in response to NO
MAMPTAAEHIKNYSGPAILSYGFRPFFLIASFWSAIAMVLWIAMLTGHLPLPTSFDMISWHVHELLYGYLPAIIAGFLLTSVPNWTGRTPVTGTLLFILVLVWTAGRIAILFSDHLGPTLTAFIDLSFLALFGLVVGREILGARDWRNLKILILVTLFFCGNAVFHAEAASIGVAYNGYGARFGVAIAIFLIMLIGGRIVPNFTRNWLARREPGRLPILFNRFDMASMGIAGAALILWIAAPENNVTAIICLLAGLVHVARLARWAGERTSAEPLVLILHIGYAFVSLGFLGVGIAGLFPDAVPINAAIHAWTAGAIGVMTLGVMTRVSFGHVGKPLHAARGTVFIYACMIVAAILRIAAGLGSTPQVVLYLAAVAWIAAFVGFAVLFGPLLVRPRQAQ